VTPDFLFLLFAPSGTAPGRGLWIFLFQMGAFIAIIYFLMIRPKVQQEKRHRERLSQIKKGDEVVTAGGIVGEVVHMKDDRITIKTGEARVVVMRDRVADVREPGAAAAPEEKKAS
jgi:preprotein translocase subunit YajC